MSQELTTSQSATIGSDNSATFKTGVDEPVQTDVAVASTTIEPVEQKQRRIIKLQRRAGTTNIRSSISAAELLAMCDTSEDITIDGSDEPLELDEQTQRIFDARLKAGIDAGVKAKERELMEKARDKALAEAGKYEFTDQYKPLPGFKKISYVHSQACVPKDAKYIVGDSEVNYAVGTTTAGHAHDLGSAGVTRRIINETDRPVIVVDNSGKILIVEPLDNPAYGYVPSGMVRVIDFMIMPKTHLLAADRLMCSIADKALTEAGKEVDFSGASGDKVVGLDAIPSDTRDRIISSAKRKNPYIDYYMNRYGNKINVTTNTAAYQYLGFEYKICTGTDLIVNDVFHHETGLLISISELDKVNDNPRMPGARSFRAHEKYASSSFSDEYSSVCSVTYYTEPSSINHTLYAKSAGSIYKVPSKPIKPGMNVKPGIYVRVSYYDYALDNFVSGDQYYPLEDALDRGIVYNNEPEAQREAIKYQNLEPILKEKEKEIQRLKELVGKLEDANNASKAKIEQLQEKAAEQAEKDIQKYRDYEEKLRESREQMSAVKESVSLQAKKEVDKFKSRAKKAEEARVKAELEVAHLKRQYQIDQRQYQFDLEAVKLKYDFANKQLAERVTEAERTFSRQVDSAQLRYEHMKERLHWREKGMVEDLNFQRDMIKAQTEVVTQDRKLQVAKAESANNSAGILGKFLKTIASVVTPVFA